MFNHLFQSVIGKKGDAQSQQAITGRMKAQLEVVDDSSDGLDACAARLPCVEVAELAPLHHIHTASVVGLFVQHPPEQKGRVIQVSAVWSCEVPTLSGYSYALQYCKLPEPDGPSAVPVLSCKQQ